MADLLKVGGTAGTLAYAAISDAGVLTVSDGTETATYGPAGIGSTEAITANTISEVTAAAGVTIDGVLCKDNSVTVGTAGAIVTDTVSEKTAAAGVTADGVLLKDGGVTLANGAAILADVVSEKVATTGVTIDGLRLKDAAITPVAGGAAFVDLSACATGEGDIILADNLATALEIREGANSVLKVATTNSAELITFGYPTAYAAAAQTIADPGNAGAISVTRDGVCMLTSAGAETRTLAIPTYVGQRLTLCVDVYVGDIVVTVAQAFNQAGNTTITMNTAGDTVALVGVKVGGAFRWRVLVNDGTTLGP